MTHPINPRPEYDASTRAWLREAHAKRKAEIDRRVKERRNEMNSAPVPQTRSW